MKLYGKEKQLAYFAAALRNRTVGHLYVFEGAVGMGKKTLCAHLAKMLVCVGDSAPCGTCSHCVKALSHNHPDIITVCEADGRALTVETARNVVAAMHIKPFLSARKVYIIPDGETLSPAVQNTLLKAFEEPPPYVTILMTTTSAGALLKTVLSRAIVLPIHGLSTHAMETFLCDMYPNRAADAPLLAALSNGSIGQAVQLAENTDYMSMRQEFYDAIPALIGSESGIYSLLTLFETYKSSLPTLLSLFSIWMRDALYIQNGESTLILNRDFQESLSAFSAKITPYAAISAAGKAAEIASSIGKGSNYTLWITDFLIECWRLCNDTNYRCTL